MQDWKTAIVGILQWEINTLSWMIRGAANSKQDVTSCRLRYYTDYNKQSRIQYNEHTIMSFNKDMLQLKLEVLWGVMDLHNLKIGSKLQTVKFNYTDWDAVKHAPMKHTISSSILLILFPIAMAGHTFILIF